MGKALTGGATHEGNVDLLTPSQKAFLEQVLGGQGQAANQAYSDFLKPYDPEQFKEMFQKSFVDPAQQTLNRQIIPGIKENFLGLNESGSSALNRALAQSATDVSTGLGREYINQYNQQNNNRLNALSGLSGAAGQRTFDPVVSHNQGILGPLIGLGGQGLGGLFNRYF